MYFQRISFCGSGNSLLSHHLCRCGEDPGRVERKEARGEEKTDAHSCIRSLARLELTRCYCRLAKRRESKSAASATQTFSATDARPMAVIYVGLNCLVWNPERQEGPIDHSLQTDASPQPQRES